MIAGFFITGRNEFIEYPLQMRKGNQLR